MTVESFRSVTIYNLLVRQPIQRARPTKCGRHHRAIPVGFHPQTPTWRGHAARTDTHTHTRMQHITHTCRATAQGRTRNVHRSLESQSCKSARAPCRHRRTIRVCPLMPRPLDVPTPMRRVVHEGERPVALPDQVPAGCCRRPAGRANERLEFASEIATLRTALRRRGIGRVGRYRRPGDAGWI